MIDTSTNLPDCDDHGAFKDAPYGVSESYNSTPQDNGNTDTKIIATARQSTEKDDAICVGID